MNGSQLGKHATLRRRHRRAAPGCTAGCIGKVRELAFEDDDHFNPLSVTRQELNDADATYKVRALLQAWTGRVRYCSRMAGGSERHRPQVASGAEVFHTRLVRSGFIEYDRVIFFSDAVFAIAITLLAVNLRVPDMADLNVGHMLGQTHTISAISGFAVSFAVIAFFWFGHHSTFRSIVALDRRMIALNLLFLGTIAFLPYPTDVLSQSNAETAGVIFYAICCAAAGLAEAGLWLYATYSKRGLVTDSVEPIRLFVLLRILRIPAIFALSIPIAVIKPRAAMYFWILIWISGALINRFTPASVAAAEADAPEQTD
jgi:TMEM175 potassium channel family protein